MQLGRNARQISQRRRAAAPKIPLHKKRSLSLSVGPDRAVKKFSDLLTIAHEVKVGKSDKNQFHTDHEMGENLLEENTNQKNKTKCALENITLL